ncbi:MAG: hypothetical protein R3C32_11145 [Chloroflexota bacterium]
MVREGGQVGPAAPSQPWARNDTAGGGSATFVASPGTPPGRHQNLSLTTNGTASSKAQLYGYQFIGTRLDAIAALGYSTYRSTATGVILPSLSIEVDWEG